MCRCYLAAVNRRYCIPIEVSSGLASRITPSFGCRHKQVYRYGTGNVSKAVECYKRAFDIDNNYKNALCSILAVRPWANCSLRVGGTSLSLNESDGVQIAKTEIFSSRWYCLSFACNPCPTEVLASQTRATIDTDQIVAEIDAALSLLPWLRERRSFRYPSKGTVRGGFTCGPTIKGFRPD